MADTSSPRHPRGAGRDDDIALGSALALSALAPIAIRLADQRAREERAAREEREAEERAERDRLRAQAQRQLTQSAKSEVFILFAWMGLLFAASLTLSILLTFGTGDASFGTRIGAAFHYQWLTFAISAGAMLLAGWIYDGFQAARGEPAWSKMGNSHLDLLLLTVAIAGVFLFGAGHDGRIPPSAWSLVPISIGGAFILTLLLRIATGASTPTVGKAVALVACGAALAIAWVVAPQEDLPSPATQRHLGRLLISAVPMSHCSIRPVGALPSESLRDSVDSVVRCHQGDLRGTFVVFRNERLYRIYVSERENSIEDTHPYGSQSCGSQGGSYISPWFEEDHPNVDLGPSLCYGSGKTATLAWANDRTLLYSSITGRNRRGLYDWWHHNSVPFRRPA